MSNNPTIEDMVMEVASLFARRNAAVKRRDELSGEHKSIVDTIGSYEAAIRDKTAAMWKEAQIRLEGQEKKSQEQGLRYGLDLDREYDATVLSRVPIGVWVSDCAGDPWEYLGNKKWISRNEPPNNQGEVSSEFLAHFAPFKVKTLP